MDDDIRSVTNGGMSRGHDPGERAGAVAHNGAAHLPPTLPPPPSRVCVWVCDATTGAPIAGARYEIRAADGKLIAVGQTASLAPIEREVPAEGHYELRVVSGEAIIATAIIAGRPPAGGHTPEIVLVR
jgi:hypothetical protein